MQAERVNGMDIDQAREILDVSEEDDASAVKKKYHQLMGRHHPDAVGSDSPEYISRAQKINEAYHLLRKENFGAGKRSSRRIKWTADVNEKAFCERNIYLYYSMENAQGLYYKAARGKYMWDPKEEDFSLFLVSIRCASAELLERAEESSAVLRPEEEIKELRFKAQVMLLYSLAQQFIHPVKVLRKIEGPGEADEEGRAIYVFQAFLGKKGYDRNFKILEQLQKEEPIIPGSFQDNKILVLNSKEQMLGHLSFTEDYLHFLVVPLLKSKLAQVKIIVREAEVRKKLHPYRIKVTLDFYFRLEKEAEQYKCGVSNQHITELLEKYKESF